jgi:hypothetical protein
MASYTIINATEATLTDVNAGGVDVGAMSYRDGVVLTNTELATLCSTQGVTVTSDLTGVAFAAALKRAIGIAAGYLNPLA